MKPVSNYVSVILVLLISLAITGTLSNMLLDYQKRMISIEHEEDNATTVSIYTYNNTKYIFINKTGEEPIIIGQGYNVLANTTEILLISAPIQFSLIIIHGGEIYEV